MLIYHFITSFRRLEIVPLIHRPQPLSGRGWAAQKWGPDSSARGHSGRDLPGLPGWGEDQHGVGRGGFIIEELGTGRGAYISSFQPRQRKCQIPVHTWLTRGSHRRGGWCGCVEAETKPKPHAQRARACFPRRFGSGVTYPARLPGRWLRGAWLSEPEKD